MVINVMEKNRRRGEQRRIGDEGCNFEQDDQVDYRDKVTFEQSLTEVSFVYFFNCGFISL